MKKIFTTILSFCLFANLANAQQSLSEMAPIGVIKPPSLPQINAQFDPLFTYYMDSITGFNGKAGVCHFNGEFWVSKWAGDTIFTIDATTGMLTSSFIIPGTTTSTSGVRAFTTDGTSIYMSVNTNSIKKIDPVTKTLISTISCASTGVTARSLSYDATANGGAGGLWVSNFGTDIFLIDLSGNVLNSIAAATHGLTAMYGTAYDDVSTGGPYLWVFDQAFSAAQSDIVQLDAASGTPTGVSFDVFTNISLPLGGATGLAGGIFIDPTLVPTGAILTLLQGTPSNLLIGLDLDLTVGVNNISSENDIFLKLSPNPASENLRVEFENYSKGQYALNILDVTGKSVISKTNLTEEYTNIDVRELSAGIYFVQAKGNHKTSIKKLIIQ